MLLLFAQFPLANANSPSADRPVADATRNLSLYSNAALVLDENTGAVLYGKNMDTVHPIASLTKLMTAIVILDSGLPLDATIRVENDDIDMERGSRSKMRIGEVLARRDMLRLALMSSENRAATALARTFPGGRDAFVATMNRRAGKIGEDCLGGQVAEGSGRFSAHPGFRIRPASACGCAIRP